MLRRAKVVFFAGLAFALISFLAGSAGAVVIWNEAINGPLSDFAGQAQFPQLPFQSGENEIIGVTGQTSPGVIDRDYFSFNVAPGLQFTGLIVKNATSGGPMGTSFIGIGSGRVITVGPVPTPPDASFLLGYDHYSPADIGKDILAVIGNPPPPLGPLGSATFTPPLPAGNYAVWIQETGLCTCVYDFAFVLTPIPEPASAAAVLTGLAVLAAARRFRRRSP